MSRILTYTGRVVDPLNLTPDMVCLDDIAHALAAVNRYTGHTSSPYSVAHHSVLVSIYCAPEDALAGLLHDASEAYLNDVAKPIKHHPAFAFYREVEARAMDVILAHFGLPTALPASVLEADHRMLATEMRDLMPPVPPELRVDATPYARTIRPWPAEMAEHLFRSRFRALTEHPKIAFDDAINFAGEDAWGRKAA